MMWKPLQDWFAEQVIDDDTFSGLEVAAHAYAGAVWLNEQSRPPRVAGVPPMVRSFRDAIAVTVAASSLSDFYDALLAVLVSCEAELADPARRYGLPATTDLEASSGLSGVVHHAWRGRSALRQHRHRRREACGAGPTSYELRPDDQLDHLWMAFSRGAPLRYKTLASPGLQSRGVVTALGPRLDEGSLRIALCPLAGAAGPRFRVVGNGDRFVACGERAPVSVAQLAEIAAASAEERIAVLLLPELHVRPDELGGLAGASAIVLTVAGSFHVEDGELRNRAPVLVDDGYRLWAHDKRGYFRVPRRLVEADNGWFEAATVVSDEVCEGIVGGGCLQVLDTSLGRLAVVICADALDPDGYVHAIEDARPDLLFVVSMSVKTDDFEARAEQWGRLGISTMVVNVGPAGAVLGLCWLAISGSAALPPTRLRWREAALEAWRPGGGGWSQNLGGVAALHPVLGLVVDLAAMVMDGKECDHEAN